MTQIKEQYELVSSYLSQTISIKLLTFTPTIPIQFDLVKKKHTNEFSIEGEWTNTK